MQARLLADEQLMDRLETDATSAELRRRAFKDRRRRALWAIPIRTYANNLLLLWQEHPTDRGRVLIVHLGPELAGLAD